jgi:hypothetical protein
MNNYAKHMGFNPPTSVQIITLVPRELLYTQNSFLLYILLCPKPKTHEIGQKGPRVMIQWNAGK